MQDTSNPTQQPGRPLEIEEWSNRHFIHRVARVGVPYLHRKNISPNAVSVTGLFFSLCAAASYYLALQHDGAGFWPFAGFGFMLAWHICDGMDGQLARLSGKASEFGRIIDGICDHLAFGAVYVALALAISDWFGENNWIWALGWLAAIAHAIQAAAYELRRQTYFDLLRNGSPTLAPTTAKSPSGFMQRLAALYARVQDFGNAGLNSIRTVMHGRQQSEITHHLAPSVKRWSILSANHRTMALFAFVATGWPAGYFWFELIGLSAALIFLQQTEKSKARKLAAYFNDATKSAKAR